MVGLDLGGRPNSVVGRIGFIRLLNTRWYRICLFTISFWRCHVEYGFDDGGNEVSTYGDATWSGIEIFS